MQRNSLFVVLAVQEMHFLRWFSCDNNVSERDASEAFLFEVWLWEQTLGIIGEPVILTLSRL